MSPAEVPLRVLVVGPAPAGENSRGGMATVATLMAAHPDPRIRITMVPTFVNSSVWRWVLVGVSGGVAPPPPVKWTVLFDGKTLKGWKDADFYGKGKSHVKDGAMVMEKGKALTGLA